MQFSQALRAPRRPPSRRDRGMTALIEGFFGFMWFGWGRANASSGLSVVLAVGAVLAVAVATAGGVLAFRSPASESSLHERAAWRRYNLIVGLEFALAGVGAAALGAGVLLTLFAAFALAGVDVDTATLPAARR